MGRRLLDETDDDASGRSEDERMASAKKKNRQRRRRRSSWAREDEDDLKQRHREGGQPHRESSCSSEEVAEMYRKVIKMASENKITTKNAWSLSLIDHMSEVVVGADDDDVDDQVDREKRLRQRQEHAVNFQKASCTLEAGVKIYCSRVDDTFDSSVRALERLHRRSQKQTDHEEEVEEALDEEDTATKKKTRKPATKTLVEDEELISLAQVDEEEPTSFALAQRGVDGGSARDLLLQRLWCVSARVAHEGEKDQKDDGASEPLKSSFAVVDLPTALCTPLAHFRAAQTHEEDEEVTAAERPLPEDFFPPEPSVEEADHVDAGDPMDEAPPFEGDDVVDDHQDYGAPVYDDDDEEDDEEDEEEARPIHFTAEMGLRAVADDDYDLAYLDTAGLNLGRNEWAGLSHWKLATARQGKPVEKKRAPSKKKKLPGLDFDAPPPPPFVPAPKLKKQPIKAVDPDSLVLPKDLGITARDLYKLFLVDRYMIATGSGESSDGPVDASFVDNAGGDDDAFFQGGDYDEDYAAPQVDDATQPEGGIGLLSAAHQVENIDITYATTAKRVDVRALKAALWEEIDGRKGSSSSSSKMTFSSLVRKVNEKQNFGTDATMSFYFISLLHLANEHQLNISDDLDQEPVLSDLSISRNVC